MPYVSVIIPVYNGEMTIGRAISSVLTGNSGIEIQIVVADDGSTDNTRQVVSALSTDCVTLVSTPHSRSGPAVARNTALDHAAGDWIALLDSDDWWLPGRLHRLLDDAHRLSADLIADDLLLVSSDAQSVSLFQQRGLRHQAAIPLDQASLIRHDLGLLQPLFRRQIIESPTIRQPVGGVTEDFAFNFHCIGRARRAIVVNYGLYCYQRGHVESTASSSTMSFWLQSPRRQPIYWRTFHQITSKYDDY